MLERLREYLLYINLKKYKFNTIKIEFLNFIMFSKNIQIDSKKIKTIKK